MSPTRYWLWVTWKRIGDRLFGPSKREMRDFADGQFRSLNPPEK